MRQTQLQILGKEKAVDTAYTVLTKLLDNVEDGGSIDKGKVRYLIELVKREKLIILESL